MSFLDHVDHPKNLQDPPFTFLVTELFNKLVAVNKDNLNQFANISEKKRWIIQSFINSFKTHIGEDIFPCSRLIFPDKARRLYFIRETTLARLIVKMYRIPKQSDDYQVLYNWKLNYNKSKRFSIDAKNLRDLPLRAARIIANRRLVSDQNDDSNLSQESSLNVSIINKVLDDLVETTHLDDQINLLKPVFNKLSIEEIKWILHIILKKTILGNFEAAFFNYWHPDAYRLFQVCNNLQKTFNYLIDPKKRLDEKQLVIQPTLPFLPQLAHKIVKNYPNLVKQMQQLSPMDSKFQKQFNDLNLNQKFIIEEKMDGDRMVLHKKGKFFKFYSRRLKDYSFLYGENFEIGSLTKYLGNAFPNNVDSVILDGEMVAWDYKRNVVLPFGTLKSSAIQEAVRQYTTIDQYEQQSAYPYFLVFDILHLNGVNLTNHPLFFRRNILQKIIKPVPHRFEILPAIYASNINDLQEAIKKVVSSRSEGILVKHIQLKYFISHRNHQWVKVKPEYLEKFGENLDLCVIGKIPAIKNSYICGLQDENGVFQSFCTVANGFTVDDFDKIDRITFGKWVKYDSKNPPPTNLIKFGTKKPNFWIDPKDSVILEIKARAIDSQVETTYAVGTTLHNLYCRAIREDKSIDDATTLSDYRLMKEKYSQNLDNSQKTNSKRRKLNQGSFIVPQKKIKIKSQLFKNFNFIIASEHMNNGDRITIQELSNLIKKYGGHIKLGLDMSSSLQTIIITEKEIPTCKGYFDKGFDLIKPNFIFECINHNSILQLEPQFIFKSSNVENFCHNLDKYGDSFVIHMKFEDLPDNKFVKLESQELKEYRRQLVSQDLTTPLRYLFLNTKFFVVTIDNKKPSLYASKVQDRINRFGGLFTTNFLEASYIVIPNEENSLYRNKILSQCNSISHHISENIEFKENGFTKIPHMVMESFIDACINENAIPDPDDYKFI